MILDTGYQKIKGTTSNDKGHYTVKSGYHLERNSFSTLPHQSNFPWQKWWNLVWKLNIPPKIRIFFWRDSWDFIPTASNLRMKHVPTDVFCYLCRFDQATTCHCLFFCPKVCVEKHYFLGCFKEVKGSIFCGLLYGGLGRMWS